MRGKNTIVFDFDGTLARIASSPGGARIGARQKAALAGLAQESRIIILTGRPADFVERQLRGMKSISVIGLYGNAHLRKSKGMLRLEAQAQKEIRAMKGMLVESKPAGFALHYRNSGLERAAAMEKMRGMLLRAKKAAKVIEGRKCIEFLPRNAKTKADTLEKLVAQRAPERVVFIGDDHSDCIAIKRCLARSNFQGALVRSGEVRCEGVGKIARKDIFSFAKKAVGGRGRGKAGGCRRRG